MLDDKVVIGGGQKDCLNTIRLLAAIEVLYGHVIIHLKIGAIPVFNEFIHFFWGVPIFFTLSGYLIWQSIGRSNSFVEYCKKRFWRIYPELWVAVIIEIIALLLLYHQPINWPQFGLFVFGQSTIFQFWTPDCLRGYGCGTPNGALWTICVLIQFYVVAYPTYKMLHGKRNCIWAIVILLFTVLGVATDAITAKLPEMIANLYGVSFLPYFWMFLIASFVAEHKEKIIPFVKKWWWAFLTIALIKNFLIEDDIQLSLYTLFRTVSLFFAVLGIGYALPLLNIKTDISYGIYILHMTVVNGLMALGLFNNPLYFVVVLVITCLMAFVSTSTIGKKSMERKRMLSSQLRVFK